MRGSRAAPCTFGAGTIGGALPCPPTIHAPGSVIAAVTATGIIWSRYATQITPVNYNLLTVNVFMAATGIWQLYRIASHKPTVAPTAA